MIGWFQAIVEIFKFVRESGGAKKAADILSRYRAEIQQSMKDLPDPGHSKGY